MSLPFILLVLIFILQIIAIIFKRKSRLWLSLSLVVTILTFLNQIRSTRQNLYIQKTLMSIEWMAHDPTYSWTANKAAAFIAAGNDDLSVGDFKAALRKFEKAREFDDKIPAVHNNIGIALMQLGQLKDAESAFKKALDIDPPYYKAKMNLAVVRLRQGKNDEALQILKPLSDEHPEDARIRINLATAFLNKGEKLEAANEFEKYLTISSSMPSDSTKVRDLIKELRK